MNNMLYLDLETFSATPISHGTYKYAANASILLFAFAFDDDAATVVDIVNGEEFPPGLLDYIENSDGGLCAHNAMFDRNVLRYNGLPTDISRWQCTRIQALSSCLPGGLGQLGTVLGLPVEQAKDADGKKLIHLFCKPLGKNRILSRATRDTHPTEWARFKQYAALDVEAMRACSKRMPPLSNAELCLYHLDQRVNDKGFLVDHDLIQAALRADRSEKARLAKRTLTATHDVLPSTTQRDVMIAYLADAHGLAVGDLTKATVRELIEDEATSDAVRDLLQIRLKVCSTSVAKYRAVEKMSNDDGVCRGTFQHLGAMRSGRAAGKGLQPQNLPSRDLLSADAIAFGIDALKDGSEHEVFPDLTRLLVSAVRGLIIARPGHKFIISDFANIEGRVAAWAAGETWKVQAFRDYDAGFGHDLYNLAYARSFHVPIQSVTKAQRQIGKTCELMLGYQGGVGAFLTGAASLGFDIDILADRIYHTLDPDLVKEAESFRDWLITKDAPTFGLSKKAFIACDVLKRAWRLANPNITAMWRTLEDAARSAIASKGESFNAGTHVSFLHGGKMLDMRLPSGRLLRFPKAHIDQAGKIKFLGVIPYVHKWGWCWTYGGKLAENLAQAVSRDLLYDAMQRAWDAGYETVLHVHDELVTEVPDTNDLTIVKLNAIMAANPGWATGLPLAADGFEDRRYRK